MRQLWRLASVFMSERITLDREAFRRTLRVKALRVPSRLSQDVRRLVRHHLLTTARVPPVQKDTNDATRLVLLKDDIAENVPEDVQRLLERDDVEWVDHELSLGYEHLTAAEVIRKLLPTTVVAPTAFESIGHIAHLNLRPEHAPYKHAIGQVLLDKNPSIQTVINKVATVENAFRVMEYEVLAGDASLETEVRQSGCRFRLDFGKVYWNSRLEYEHTRLVDVFDPGETVVDLMAGIGPFAIPAAKKGCRVVANDINPDSYRYLRHNIALNAVVDRVLPLNLDARHCMRVLLGHHGDLDPFVSEDYRADVAAFQERRKKRRVEKSDAAMDDVIAPPLPLRCHHIVMNYPQYAIGFLDMFRGSFDRAHWTAEQMPMVHCYAFMQKSETPEMMRQKCENVLGAAIDAEVHVVRDVAPYKVMCCVRFRLPYDVATQPGRSGTAAEMERISDVAI